MPKPSTTRKQEEFRLLVCGGRDYSNYDMVKTQLDAIILEYRQFNKDRDVTVLLCCGAAHGADFLAMKYAKERRLNIRLYPADWKAHGKGAGPIRNIKMLKEFKPDYVAAFPGGPGTAHMVKISQEANVPVRQWVAADTLPPGNAGLGITG